MTRKKRRKKERKNIKMDDMITAHKKEETWRMMQEGKLIETGGQKTY